MSKALHTTGFCLLLSLSLMAFGPTIERDDLVVSVRAPKSVVPGQFETFILELTNDYDFALNFEVTVDKPKSWRFLSPLQNVRLEPGEKKTVIFLMDIDRACEIGEKDIRFEFYDKTHDVKIVESIVTTVQNLHQIETRAIRYPRHLTSGEDFEVEFLVRNLGNCYENVEVTSENGTVNVSSILLAPNSNYHIKVKQRAPDLQYVGYVASDIVLVTDSAEKPLRERVSIKTFPKMTRRTDPYQRFPLSVSLIYFGAQTAAPYSGGLQVELEGRGHIDREENHHLFVKARGPNRFSVARVGNFDQYTLEYKWQQSRHNETKISLGDFAYNLTPITEMYRWARGVGVSQTFKKMEVGAFYNQPRFIKEIKQQFAAYAKYSLRSYWDIQVNAMQKQFSEGDRTGNLVSFRNSLKIKNQLIKAEYAIGGAEGNTGSAANIDLSGGIKKLGISYSSQNIYASQFFPGYYTNSLFTNTNLRYRRKKLMLNAGLSYNDANPAQDTIMNSAPYSTNASLGATYYLRKELKISLSLINRAKEDRFPTRKFSYRENAVRYRLGYRNDAWDVLLDGELAQTQNLLVNNEKNIGNSFNVRGRVDRSLFKGLRIGGFTQYLYTNRYAEDLKAYLLYGGNMSYRPMPNLSVAASVRNNYLIDEYNSDRSLVDLQVRGRHGAHQLSIGVSHALIRNTVDRKDFFVNARYTCRIKAPIRKKEGLYSLTGTLKSDNPRDASGVILHLAGQSVISDEYGRFEFNDLPPGIHYLHIDMGTLNIGLITGVETPLEVEILPRERTYLNIDIVRSGNIVGKVEFSSAKGLPASEGGAYPLKVIKATDGKREMLTYTDDNGNYSFKQVLPGNWKVRVVENGPDGGQWSLVENNIEVNLRSSQTEEVNFEMTQKERKIKFKNQQSLDLKIKKD